MNLGRRYSRRMPVRRLLLESFTAAFCWAAAAPGLAGPVTAQTGQIEIPTYPWSAVRHPYFRGTDNLNVYPYVMQDFLSRQQTRRTYKTVILENEYLRVTFLPELGGKIYDVLDKTTGEPMFYVNHVVKPGLIAQCGAWTSGGVEWNTGPQGHTVSCMVPVRVEILPPEKDGSRGVAVGETERIYGTKWTVVVTLRPGRAFLEERIRIYNPTDTIRPYYFWNCTAVPNTPGFRFIYPMTLGCDHSGETFFQWPIDHGKDLTRGTNYLDASSIFAWYCDQDFFGSYCDDLGRGLVSYANHFQVPGKKAWTWGQGGFGKMHQMDLTDSDGPYNEVQTGPLLTQAQVGWLDPCQAVEWNEWWYPIHAIGGFTFANGNLAINASLENGQVRCRLLGTAVWPDATVKLSKDGRQLDLARCRISPRQPAEFRLGAGGQGEPFEIEIAAASRRIAAFRLPLDLPVRHPPEKKSKPPETASELVEAGWQDFLFARFPEAEQRFKKAIALDAGNPEAYAGLAHLNLDRDPAAAAAAARSALAVDPIHGGARYALAAAEYRLGQESAALDDAWLAARDPAVAVAARALVAKLNLRRHDYPSVIAALSADGPWREDPACRNRLALALMKNSGGATTGARASRQPNLRRAVALGEENLRLDPLDPLARDLLLRLRGDPEADRIAQMTANDAGPYDLVKLLADYSELGDLGAIDTRTPAVDTRTPSTSSLDPASIIAFQAGPVGFYWLAYHTNIVLAPGFRYNFGRDATAWQPTWTFPYQPESLPALRWAVEHNPQDGAAALCLGHLLCHLGRYAEAREQWKRAAELGAEPVIAWRALGMAAKNLDGDLKAGRQWLEKAAGADPKDAIVARDLANLLFDLADKSASESEKRDLLVEARTRLNAAFESGRGRSDFVTLLGRAQNRLGDFAETAQMLDNVRVTVWEGAHEVHDLFEQAHLALGEARLKAGQPAEALAEFNRALDYPENLATGKLENAHEAHVQYLRGNALTALGRKAQALAAWKLAANEPASPDSRIEEARKKAKQALHQAGQ